MARDDAKFFRLGAGPEAAGPPSAADALIDAQFLRNPARTDRSGPRLSLLLTQVERHYGADWYWSPNRWDTADGLVPWPVFLVMARAMAAHRAEDARLLVWAQVVIHGDDGARRQAHEQMQDDAEPGT